MKRLITILAALLITGLLISQTSNTYKYVINADGGIKASAGATSNVTSFSSYIIEKIGSTIYARPGIGTSYTAYSGANLTSVLNNAMGQLTLGGIIQIKEGTYDDLLPMVIPYDKITIVGSGIGKTILKLIANASIGVARGDMFFVNGKDNITFAHLELDGNKSNQDEIDNGASSIANSNGIFAQDTVATTNTDDLLVEKCYIHDFTRSGIVVDYGLRPIIKDNRIEDNGYGAIEFWFDVQYGQMINNIVGGSGNIELNVWGDNNIISGNICLPSDGVNGSINSRWAIGIEWGEAWDDVRPRNNMINNNMIIGGGSTLVGIRTIGAEHIIDGNTIIDLADDTDAIGIYMQGDSLSVVKNNVLKGNTYYGIIADAAIQTTIENNNFRDIGYRGISLRSGSIDCNILNNVMYSNTSYQGQINIASGCNYNYFSGNILHSLGFDAYIVDAGSYNLYQSNYHKSNEDMIPNVGRTNIIYAASVGGKSLLSGTQFTTITSSNSDYIILLPTTSALSIGQIISGTIVANGCELRVAAAQAATVYINGVTTSVEAAIPADSSFEITCIDATHWILKVWDANGVYSAPVPDAIE